MLKEEEIEEIQPVIKSVQIICSAMIGGLIVAAAIFCAITDWTKIHTSFNGTLVLAGAGLGLIGLPVAFIVPGLVTSSAIAAMEDSNRSVSKLAGMFQNKTIIQFAMLEGPAFLNLIAFFIDHSLVSLGIVAFLIALMAMLFPRTDSVISWIQNYLD